MLERGEMSGPPNLTKPKKALRYKSYNLNQTKNCHVAQKAANLPFHTKITQLWAECELLYGQGADVECFES